MRSTALCAAAAALALGCAANYYDRYKAEHPDWYGEYPAENGSLYETLAGLYAPPQGDWQRTVSKLTVLRLEGGAATALAPAEVDAILAEQRPGDYAVVALMRCQSEYDLERFQGEKTLWFLLVGDRLVAYDSTDFAERCVVFNSFRPARGEQVELERAVIAHRDAEFPPSMEHTLEFYRKGLAYLEAGRSEDARAMLARGDASFDVGARGEQHVRFEGPSRQAPIAGKDVIAKFREALVEGLERPAGSPPPIR